MATNHHYIYLGQERGKRRVYKVGQTRQTCHARCKSADFHIGMAFELNIDSVETLKSVEDEILLHFRDTYSIEHGLEYFRLPKLNWEATKQFFERTMIEILTERGITYTIKSGWTQPYSY